MLAELKNITIHYGKAKAVSNASIEISKGSVVTVIGANGAGKSTLIKAISGLIPISSGEIWFEGKMINGLEPHKIVNLGLVQVPEGRRLFPHLSVLSNLKLGASLRKNKPAINHDLEEVFNRFPILRDRTSQKAGTMSGGEQQMLAIARGLMADPKLLILDEPSLGLAPKMVAEMVPIIKGINKKGVSVLLVEQNIPLALKVAERGYALQVGEVVLQGDIDQFRDNDVVQKAYLGS